MWLHEKLWVGASKNVESNTVWKVSVFGVFLVRIFPYSVQMCENTDQKNSEYGHFLRSVKKTVKLHANLVTFTEEILWCFYKTESSNLVKQPT